MTNFIYQQLPAVMADHLEQFLDLRHKACNGISAWCTLKRVLPRSFLRLTDMEDRCRELDVAKVTRTLRHALIASGTFIGPVDGSEVRIIQPAFPGLLPLLVLNEDQRRTATMAKSPYEPSSRDTPHAPRSYS